MKFGRGVIRPFNFTLRRRVEGRPIKIPVVGGLKVGISGERFLLDVLELFLPKLEGAFVDVGVNLGQTLSKVKLVDPTRSYFGFEPNAACHAYLEKLVRANNWPNVTILPCGLSDRTSILRLHVSAHDATDGLGSFLPSLEERPEAVLNYAKHAVAFRFAELAHLIDERIAFLKIDVEGAELEVVRGMAETIRRDEPIVAIELMPDRTLVGRHEQTVALLQSLGYDLFCIEKQSNNRWAGLQAMPSYLFPVAPSMTDYLAIPRSKPSLLDHVPQR